MSPPPSRTHGRWRCCPMRSACRPSVAAAGANAVIAASGRRAISSHPRWWRSRSPSALTVTRTRTSEMSTKVILRADIADLGKRGDICDVSDGYARNYLLPKGLALRASDGAVAQAGSMRRARDVRDAHERAEAEAIASQLVPQTITIRARSGAEGRLFGSVTAGDVAEAVEN